MSDKVIVEIFGLNDQPSGESKNCTCGCKGGCCGPAKSMTEIYDEFVNRILKSNIKNRIDVRFIDILKEDMEQFDYAMEAMDKGYELPLTAINGKVRFYGGISYSRIYGTIRNHAY